MNRADEPAYPVDPKHGRECGGLTIRELFAMAAMQGLLANPKGFECDMDDVAIQARVAAGALLAELAKGEAP